MNALLLATIVPFGTSITLPPNSVASYSVTVQNTNSFGTWSFSDSVPSFPANGTARFVPECAGGWHGTTFWTDKDGKIVRTSLDGSKQSLDGVLLANPKGYWSFMPGRAMGAWQGFTWPKEYALQIKASKCILFVVSKGSPSMGLEVIGDDNDITVDVEQGQQSNMIQDLAAVRIVGRGNTVRGVSHGQMCAVFFNGKDNRALDMALIVEGVGDDTGALYVKGGSDGFRATNVTVWMPKVEYASKHGRHAFYLDNKTSGSVIYNCAAYGQFDTGVMVHGGNDTRIERFRSLGPKQTHKFAPFYLTPNTPTTGNRAISVTDGSVINGVRM